MTHLADEHLGQERERILRATQRCFLRSGLHGTTMEEIHRESGLPEHVVTRHFKSKDDLVAGIAANILRIVTGFFEEIRATDQLPPLDEVVERFAHAAIELSGPDGAARLVPIYWASALYNEEMAGRAQDLIARSRAGWIEIAERARATGDLAPQADPQAVGTTLACLLPGIVLQRLLLDDIDAAELRRGIRALAGRAS